MQIYNKITQLQRKMVILTEKILFELETRHNDTGEYSAYSKVYLGDNWVKKISKEYNGKYPKHEILQYQLMEKHPEIFPITKIKKMQDGVLILQQKVNVHNAKKIWDELEYKYLAFSPNSDYDFRTFVELIATSGMRPKFKHIQDVILSKLKDPKRFKEFVELSLKLFKLRQSNPSISKFSIDLHDGNYGVDNSGDLKIIDFLVD